jgi:hypothetical protein
LNIKGRFVEGSTNIPDHPEANILYHLHGEIRGGKLLISDYCVQDETEFATMIYPDLMKPSLSGIWNGLDGHNHLIAAPTILSRVERTPCELINILQQSIFNLVDIHEATTLMYSDGRVLDIDSTGDIPKSEK